MSNYKVKFDKSTYPIEVQVIGTELRHSNILKAYTIYIIEISITDIVQRVYLRYSEVLEIQELTKATFPNLAVTYLKDSIWTSSTSPKEIESRTININSFLSTILQSQEFKANPKNKVILQKIGLPTHFYTLPEVLSKNKDQSRNFSLTDVSSALTQIQHSKSTTNLDEFESPQLAKIPSQSQLDNRSSRGRQQRFSASKIIRSSENSMEKEEKKVKQRTQFITLAIHTHHPAQP